MSGLTYTMSMPFGAYVGTAAIAVTVTGNMESLVVSFVVVPDSGTAVNRTPAASTVAATSALAAAAATADGPDLLMCL